MNEIWLKCAVFKGMFSDEVAIRYSRADRSSSFFVPKEKVRNEGAEGKVLVRSFQQSGQTWAVLPTEDQATIPVNEGDLFQDDPLQHEHP